MIENDSHTRPTNRRPFVLTAPLRSLFCAALLLCSALPAMADYRLGAGDAIEISVAGIPDLKRTVTIDADGRISYPLMGTTSLEDLSLKRARAKIKAALGSKIFRQKTPTGLENVILIQPDHITVTIAKYRPVYVNGSVRKPGEYTFRPNMTVRQAIALAGGRNPLRIRTADPLITLSDLRSEREALWVEFTKEKARIWRINSEMESKGADKQSLIRSIPLAAPIPRSTVSAVVDLAARLLSEHETNNEHQIAFIHASTERLTKQISVIALREKKEKQGSAADAVEYKRLLRFYKKGTLVQSRLAEVRRAMLLSATRTLQTTVQLIEMKKQKDDLSRKLDKNSEDRRVKLLIELEAATLRLSQIQSKLRATDEKINYLMNPNSHPPVAADKAPEIFVFRMKEKERKRLVADEAFLLEPGDLVEVRTRLALSLFAPNTPGDQPKRADVTP